MTRRDFARMRAAAPALLDALVHATSALHAVAYRLGAPTNQAQIDAVDELIRIIRMGQAAIDKATKDNDNG